MGRTPMSIRTTTISRMVPILMTCSLVHRRGLADPLSRAAKAERGESPASGSASSVSSGPAIVCALPYTGLAIFRQARANGCSFPIGLAAEVCVDCRCPARVSHSRKEISIDAWGVDQSLEIDFDDAALVRAIDRYCAPRDGKQFPTHPQKASDSDQRVGHAPGVDVEHELLDLAQELPGNV